ncbi:hypothetical protein [Paenibacillus sp. FSL R7-0337]|uniref:hypothetical protein n=1 Tax=Paenibacillus sp. FSL R7-0337 TaxID=1926588 RepID=UPI00096EB5B5|nr:hypothetical protein [Paenibacillus sp. FSL R7-0337]OMG00427.1 hypothetical protein BK147_04295 [Paenibacillus sp. FSL R7-0337]
MNQRKIVNLTVIILIICIFYYFFVSGGTAAVGRIEKKVEKNNHLYIKVKLENGTLENIKVPSIVWPFLKEKESYFMAYKYNLLRKPYLVKIKEDEI